MEITRGDLSVQLLGAAIRSVWCLALVLFGMAALGASRAHAQGSPRQVLVGIIHQLQTGVPDPAWYSQELWQALAAQTGSAGIPALRKLGPVQDIFIVRQQQLPHGWLYSMTARHSNGEAAWLLGISNASNRVEYANFNVDASPAPQRIPNPSPPGQPAPGLGNPAPAMADRNSEACKTFPKLC
jgi:hypothetical protein